jgi:hypothetical protein
VLTDLSWFPRFSVPFPVHRRVDERTGTRGRSDRTGRLSPWFVGARTAREAQYAFPKRYRGRGPVPDQRRLVPPLILPLGGRRAGGVAAPPVRRAWQRLAPPLGGRPIPGRAVVRHSQRGRPRPVGVRRCLTRRVARAGQRPVPVRRSPGRSSRHGAQLRILGLPLLMMRRATPRVAPTLRCNASPVGYVCATFGR